MAAEIEMKLLEKMLSSKENIGIVKTILDVWGRKDHLLDEAVRQVLKQKFQWQDFPGSIAIPVISDSVWLYLDPHSCYTVGFCNPDKEWQQLTSETLKTLLEEQPEFCHKADESEPEEEMPGWGKWVENSWSDTFLEDHDWGKKNPVDFIVEKCRFLEEKAKELLRKG